jgi:hypothetical protein
MALLARRQVSGTALVCLGQADSLSLAYLTIKPVALGTSCTRAICFLIRACYKTVRQLFNTLTQRGYSLRMLLPSSRRHAIVSLLSPRPSGQAAKPRPGIQQGQAIGDGLANSFSADSLPGEFVCVGNVFLIQP